jgi:hypothetical protein
VRCEFEDKIWQMFWRIAVDGNNATTIAEELGVTPATVRKPKSRNLRRGRGLLPDALKLLDEN